MSFYGTDYPDAQQTPPDPRPDLDLSGAPLAETRRAGLVTLSTVTPERVSWLWPSRLPLGKLVVLDGDPSVGKSTLSLDLAARTSTGARWPDGSPGGRPAGVLLLSAEDGLADTIAPRLAAAGADTSRVHALVTVTLANPDGEPLVASPSLPRDVDHIERVIVEHGIVLVVVDVLMAYLGGKVDAHRDQDVRGVLHQLAAMAERTGCCVVLLRHLNKAGGASALYRGGGSIGIIGAARAAFLVARDPEDTERRILAVTKLNIGAEPPSLAYRLVDAPEHGCARVAWEDAPTEHTAAALLAAPSTEEERDERDAVVEWLRDYLTGKPAGATAPEVYREGNREGHSRDALKRAKKRAGVEAAKTGMNGGWTWLLPAETDDEGSTKGAKGVALRTPLPSLPSVLPSSPRPHLAVVDDGARERFTAQGRTLREQHVGSDAFDGLTPTQYLDKALGAPVSDPEGAA